MSSLRAPITPAVCEEMVLGSYDYAENSVGFETEAGALEDFTQRRPVYGFQKKEDGSYHGVVPGVPLEVSEIIVHLAQLPNGAYVVGSEAMCAEAATASNQAN